MDLDDFSAVRAITDAGTFSAAAARLRVAQPALSRRIARVERELGGRLFDRQPRRAVPTSLGRAIADSAGRLAAEHTRAMDEARAIAAGRAGTIRVASLAGGIAVLARGLVRFADEHPDVWVELQTLGADDAIGALRRFDVDLATLPGSAVAADMASRRLTRWRVVVVVRTAHPLARRDSVSIEELAAHPLLMPGTEFVAARHVLAAAERAGVALRVRLRDASPEAVVSLARRGWGVGVLPDSVALPRGLVPVPLAGRPRSRDFDYVVAWLRERTQPRAAARLADVLVEETAAFR